jgi:hypothetical protein
MSSLVEHSYSGPYTGVRLRRAALFIALGVSIAGCGYVRLLRPKVLKQLNPRVVAPGGRRP